MTHRSHFRNLMPPVFLFVILLAGGPLPGQSRGEEGEDYFQKWLENDVVYLITDEERNVFLQLNTVEEKENFIEQFWLRRDPTPKTPVNEFKDEHYRRIAYVNENFGSGIPGWKTDRGRVYILFGPPDEIDSNPGGGTYLRPYYEGGGATQTFPFEKWWYRKVEGVGEDIELEFVDRSFSGEFKLAQTPYEKDMMLYVDGAGNTLQEYLGLSSRLNRPAYQPWLENSPRFRASGNYRRAKDSPFARMERFFATQTAPKIEFVDLKTVVETSVTYNELPFAIRQDAIQLNSERWVVPITLALRNQDLGFQQKGGLYQGEVQIYGRVSDLTRRLFAEFEDTLKTEIPLQEMPRRQNDISIYQRTVALPPGLYKLSLVVKSVHSERVGTGEARISLPRPPAERLSASSLILATNLRRLERLPEEMEQFVLGDHKVVPSVTNVFGSQSKMGVYMQVYNAALDQQTLQPHVRVNYLILKGSEVVRNIRDLGGNSVAYFSEDRLVLARTVALDGLVPGDYRLRVVLEDEISGQSIMGEDHFAIGAMSGD